MNVKYKGDLWKSMITCMGYTFIFYTLKHFDVESQVFDDHFYFWSFLWTKWKAAYKLGGDMSIVINKQRDCHLDRNKEIQHEKNATDFRCLSCSFTTDLVAAQSFTRCNGDIQTTLFCGHMNEIVLIMLLWLTAEQIPLHSICLLHFAIYQKLLFVCVRTKESKEGFPFTTKH